MKMKFELDEYAVDKKGNGIKTLNMLRDGTCPCLYLLQSSSQTL